MNNSPCNSLGGPSGEDHEQECVYQLNASLCEFINFSWISLIVLILFVSLFLSIWQNDQGVMSRITHESDLHLDFLLDLYERPEIMLYRFFVLSLG